MARSAKDATSTGHLFVGVDVGTTSTKAAVVDKHGHILGSGYESYPIGYDGQGRYLQDAEDWKRATIKAVDAAIADVNRDRIRASRFRPRAARSSPSITTAVLCCQRVPGSIGAGPPRPIACVECSVSAISSNERVGRLHRTTRAHRCSR